MRPTELNEIRITICREVNPKVSPLMSPIEYVNINPRCLKNCFGKTRVFFLIWSAKILGQYVFRSKFQAVEKHVAKKMGFVLPLLKWPKCPKFEITTNFSNLLIYIKGVNFCFKKKIVLFEKTCQIKTAYRV